MNPDKQQHRAITKGENNILDDLVFDKELNLVHLILVKKY